MAYKKSGVLAALDPVTHQVSYEDDDKDLKSAEKDQELLGIFEDVLKGVQKRNAEKKEAAAAEAEERQSAAMMANNLATLTFDGLAGQIKSRRFGKIKQTSFVEAAAGREVALRKRKGRNPTYQLVVRKEGSRKPVVQAQIKRPLDKIEHKVRTGGDSPDQEVVEAFKLVKDSLIGPEAETS